MIQPALLIFGFYFLSSPALRGAFGMLGALVEVLAADPAPALVGLPRFAGQPLAPALRRGCPRRGRRRLLDPPARRGTRPRGDHLLHHTFGYQFGRSAPFSIWDWRQYHAKGLPDLHWLQNVFQALLVVGALALYRWPRNRTPLQIAAFSAALLIGFEAVLTYWIYHYLVWFFPFVAIAFLMPRAVEAPVPVPAEDELPGTLAIA